MKKSRHTELQVVKILKEVEGGRLVKDVCREFGISGATYYNWKSKYGGMEASDIKRLKELKQKIASMEAKMEQLKTHEAEVDAHPDSQVSLTDPDVRSMMKAGGGSTVSYNMQTAVDSKHHLIAAHEVTNAPSDRSQLALMAGQAAAVPDTRTPTVIADPGYYKGEEFVDCYAAGIKALVPKTDNSQSKVRARHSKVDFRYDAEQNEYVCPAGQRLTYRFDTVSSMARDCGFMKPTNVPLARCSRSAQPAMPNALSVGKKKTYWIPRTLCLSRIRMRCDNASDWSNTPTVRSNTG